MSTELPKTLEQAVPHGPDEPCTCDGCWACVGRVKGCTCDIDWDAAAEIKMDNPFGSIACGHVWVDGVGSELDHCARCGVDEGPDE